MTKIYQKQIFGAIMVLLTIFIFIFFHALPFQSSSHPLGYDTGFYAKTWENQSLAMTEQGWSGLFSLYRDDYEITESRGSRFIMRLLALIGANEHEALYVFYISVLFAVGLLLFWLTRKLYGQTASLVAIVIYSLSITQFLLFTNMLWKNAIGLLLLLTAMLIYHLLANRKPILCFTLISLVVAISAFTHKTSTIIILGTFVSYFLLQSKISIKKRLIFVASGSILLLIFFLMNSKGIISAFTEYDYFNIKDGGFISWGNFLLFSLPYFALALWSAWNKLKNKTIDLPTALFLSTFIFCVLHLIFYQRVFVYLDIGAILLSASFISSSTEKLKKHWEKLWILVFMICMLSVFMLNLRSWSPLLLSWELQNIETIRDYRPDLPIFSESRKYTPWLLGFSGHRVIAPGWTDYEDGRYNWNLERWQYYWSGNANTKEQFLKEFERPVIVMLRGSTDQLKQSPCATVINDDFILFSCH